MRQSDVEQGIMNCWNVVDDIDLLYHTMDSKNEDEIANYLLGLQEIYSTKFNALFKTYEEFLKNADIKYRK